MPSMLVISFKCMKILIMMSYFKGIFKHEMFNLRRVIFSPVSGGSAKPEMLTTVRIILGSI